MLQKMVKYKTLKEMLESINRWNNNYLLSLDQTQEELPQVINMFFPDTNLDATIYWDIEVNKFWDKYFVGNNYRQKIIAYVYEDEVQEYYKEWIVNFCNILNNTYTKYTKLIKYYNDNIDNLLKTIDSTVEFNDTPQDVYQDTVNYVTTVQTNKTEGDSLINRLTQLRYKLIDVYNEWLKEFKPLFIVGAYYD